MAAKSSAAPAGTPPSPAPLVNSIDPNSLRDMLIATVSTRDMKLLSTLANAHRQTIERNFAQWQKVPEDVRNNGAAMQRYADTLIKLAEFWRDRFEDPSLMTLLSGPAQANTMQAQWESAIAQAEALSRELRFDEAGDLLKQVVAALASVPVDTPVPFHAVTRGRLAQALFAKGDVEGARDQMNAALDLSVSRQDEQGTAAALRGMYEITRYLGDYPASADYADRLAAQLGKLGNEAEAAWWPKQAARVLAGEPLCRVVFFVDDRQVEVEEVPSIAGGQLRYGFVRNRAPLSLCEGLVQRGMQAATKAKFDEAIELFAQAAKVDPYDPSPHYQWAIALMHLEKPAEAVAQYDLTEKLAPGWFSCRTERWLANEIAQGRVELPAFFALRTEEMPSDAATWEQKLGLVDHAIGRSGQLAPLMLYRGRCLLRLGRIGEAGEALGAGLARAAEPDVKTRLLVDLQMVTADRQEKRRLLDEAIALNGNLAAAAVARVTLAHLLD